MDDTVRTWLRQSMRPVVASPTGPSLGLPASVLEARIVGVAAGVRSAHEVMTAAHAVLRDLVVEGGFRAVALEGTDAVAAELHDHVRTGRGDPASLLRSGQRFVRTAEVLDAVRWLRRWSAGHPDDPVSVVHDLAPGRPPGGSLEAVEQTLARQDLDWHAATGERVVHGGGAAHVPAGDPRTVPPDLTHVNAGGLMRRALGPGYAVLALTAGEGDAPFVVPPPPRDFTEHALHEVAAGAALLDLAAGPEAPSAVLDWLRRPLRTRMIGPSYHVDRDHEARIDAGPVEEAVSAILHLPRLGPPTPLDPVT